MPILLAFLPCSSLYVKRLSALLWCQGQQRGRGWASLSGGRPRAPCLGSLTVADELASLVKLCWDLSARPASWCPWFSVSQTWHPGDKGAMSGASVQSRRTGWAGSGAPRLSGLAGLG